jgi:hypothetical protein
MQKPITCFVGLDVHKDTIAVAVAEAGREEPRFVGTVAAQWGPLSKALRRVGRCEELRIVYEAGPDKRQAISANQLPAAGNPHPEEESDRQIKARAVALILQHPLRHLAQIPLNLWWGASFSFPALVVIIAYAFRRRKYELAVMVLPAFAALLFYAAFAHLEPRYGIPTHPITICVSLALAWQYRQRFEARSVLPSVSQIDAKRGEHGTPHVAIYPALHTSRDRRAFDPLAVSHGDSRAAVPEEADIL